MTAQADRDALFAELVALRQGWGVHATDLAGRTGPQLAKLCDVHHGDPGNRERVIAAIRSSAGDLPDEIRRTIDIVFGIAPDARLPYLSDRVTVLRHALSCSDRTARRRMDDACAYLADQMAATPPEPAPADPEHGWQVEAFHALLRLDKPEPELIEHRTIVATRDGLDTITAKLSLPMRPDGDGGPLDLVADAQQGARIVRREREGLAHFRYLLALPKPLARGERHEYTIVFRIPPGQPIRNHYAFVPLIPCRGCTVRARFDPATPPAVVWRLHRLPPRVMADQLTPGPALALDATGEVALEFTDLDQGYGYGLAWLPADATVRSG